MQGARPAGFPARPDSPARQGQAERQRRTIGRQRRQGYAGQTQSQSGEARFWCCILGFRGKSEAGRAGEEGRQKKKRRQRIQRQTQRQARQTERKNQRVGVMPHEQGKERQQETQPPEAGTHQPHRLAAAAHDGTRDRPEDHQGGEDAH